MTTPAAAPLPPSSEPEAKPNKRAAEVASVVEKAKKRAKKKAAAADNDADDIPAIADSALLMNPTLERLLDLSSTAQATHLASSPFLVDDGGPKEAPVLRTEDDAAEE
eukprot:EG_transcript_49773